MKPDDFPKAKVIGKVDLRKPWKKDPSEDGMSVNHDEQTPSQEEEVLSTPQGSDDEESGHGQLMRSGE